MGRFAARPSQLNRSRAPWRPSHQPRLETRPGLQPQSRSRSQPVYGRRPRPHIRPHWRAWPSTPQSFQRRPNTPQPVPQPETHSLKEALEAISTRKEANEAQNDQHLRKETDDPRAAVRFNFQAQNFQLKPALDGAPVSFGFGKEREPHWPEISRDEEEPKVAKGPIIRRKRRASKLGQAVLSSYEQQRIPESGAHDQRFPDHIESLDSRIKGGKVGAQRFPSLFAAKSNSGPSNHVRIDLTDGQKTNGSAQSNQAPYQELAVRKEGSQQETFANEDLKAVRSGDLVMELTTTGCTSLVLKGLSSSLQLSDFMRFIGSDLSSWSLQIDKIVQRRHRHTLEPLDSYQLYFATSASAVNFVQALKRLQEPKNGKTDMSEQTSKAAFPMEGSGDQESLEPGFRTNTVTPPTLRHIQIFAAQGSKRQEEWEARMESFFSLDSYHDRPPLILVDVHPCAGYKFDLNKVIRVDSKHCEEEWDVGDAKPLRDFLNHQKTVHGQAPDRIMKQHALVKGRYIIRCASIDEARRFHRSWNKRVVPWAKRHFNGEVDQDHILTTSIVQW